MSIHNIQFHDKIRKGHKISEIFVFLCYPKNFIETQKQV